MLFLIRMVVYFIFYSFQISYNEHIYLQNLNVLWETLSAGFCNRMGSKGIVVMRYDVSWEVSMEVKTKQIQSKNVRIYQRDKGKEAVWS